MLPTVSELECIEVARSDESFTEQAVHGLHPTVTGRLHGTNANVPESLIFNLGLKVTRENLSHQCIQPLTD